jgi:hypothetical protein
MVYPDAERGGKREKGASRLILPAFSRMYLSDARSVLHYSVPLAQEVRSGKTALNDAMEVVRQYEHHAATTPLRICRKGSESRWSRIPGSAA